MSYGIMKKASIFILLGLVTNAYAADSAAVSTPPTMNEKSMQMPSTENMLPADKNKAEGAAFLSANKMKPGVVTLPDGLQYKVLVEGQGPTPTAKDTVSVHYVGTLIDGTEFDSSIKRGQPATFPVNGVIPGWVEALQLMKVGSTWEVYIPSKLAYGEQGVPPVIGPNETLIFKVQLLGIKK